MRTLIALGAISSLSFAQAEPPPVMLKASKPVLIRTISDDDDTAPMPDAPPAEPEKITPPQKPEQKIQNFDAVPLPPEPSSIVPIEPMSPQISETPVPPSLPDTPSVKTDTDTSLSILPKTPAASSEKKEIEEATPSGRMIVISGKTILPNWRPLPNTESIPESPFAGVATGATLASPIAYREEFESLAEEIRGIIRVNDRNALLVGNQMLFEGDTMTLIGKTISKKKITTKAGKNAPTAIFVGVKKDEGYAKFMIGETEIMVPIPSAKNQKEDDPSSIVKMIRSATATFVNSKGMFVAAAHLVPSPGEFDTITVKTQLGTYQGKILAKDYDTNLALGQIQSPAPLSVFPWKDKADSAQDKGMIVSYDPTTAKSRPRWLKLSRTKTNPPWLVGCPLFLEDGVAGVMAQKENKLIVITRAELKKLFSQLEIDDETTTAWKADKKGPNPERIVGLINVKKSEGPHPSEDAAQE